MNTRILIPLCAAAALLTACAKSEDSKDSSVSVETVPDDTAPPADQAPPPPTDQPEPTTPPPEQ